MKDQKPASGSWASREASAESELARAGFTRVTNRHFPATYFVFSDSLPMTPARESWQEVLADVEKLQPIPFSLEFALA